MRGWWVVYASVPHRYTTVQFAVIASSEQEALTAARVWAYELWADELVPDKQVVLGAAVRLCDVPGEREASGDS